MGNLFIRRLQHLTQDNYLDRSEYQSLKAYQQQLKTEQSPSAYMGDRILNSLERYESRTTIQFRLSATDSIKFDFTPKYAESDLLPGRTIEDRLSQVSQKDNLNGTNDDPNRCASAAVLSAFLVSGGSFADALNRLGLNQAPVLNYENIHMAQEKLYDMSNVDGRSGLSLSTTYRYQRRSGEITSVMPEGEVVSAAKTMGLKVEGILGSTRATQYERKTQVEDFFARNPRGSLLTSVHLDVASGTVRPAQGEDDVNHAVLIYKRQGKYYMLDSGGSYNGLGNARKELSPSELADLAFTSTGSIFGLTR